MILTGRGHHLRLACGTHVCLHSTVQRMSNPAGALDFSKPWEHSNVVLVVEEDRFHVHRCILGMWSEVFSTMFTAQFKEKTAKEVPLSGKKAAEIKEMLLVIYPTSSKPIDESNYAFLLDLAKEYMMAKITEKCESYLIGRLGSPKSYRGECSACGNGRDYVKKENCLELLVIAQNYGLDRLETACIQRAKRIRFTALKRDNNFEKICARNYRKIVEGMLTAMEGQQQLRQDRYLCSQLLDDCLNAASRPQQR